MPLRNAEFYKSDLKCEIYGEVENVTFFNRSAEIIKTKTDSFTSAFYTRIKCEWHKISAENNYP
jgi:hypothetical protein